ncbi:MAG: putative rane protein [Acidobacteria bacterium]|nr:putative rane protein [Acidobacteriota bacterium]
MLLTPAFVFIPAALFHCGIRNGRRAAWLTLALATLLVVPYIAQFPVTSLDGRLTIILFSGLILGIAIPALLALPMVERAEPFGRVLLSSLVASIGGLAATELALRALFGFSPYAVQLEQARAMAAQILTKYQASAPPLEVMQTMKRWMEYGSFVLPAWFLIEAAIVFVLSLVMLGRLRAWRRHAESLPDAPRAIRTYLFRNLSLPEWLLFVFVIGGLTPLLSGTLQKIAANVLAVVTFLYLLQGLAIIRSMLAAAGAGFLSVLLTFLTLGFLTVTGIALLPLSITGLFDSFFDFRHFKRKDDSHESHTD